METICSGPEPSRKGATPLPNQPLSQVWESACPGWHQRTSQAMHWFHPGPAPVCLKPGGALRGAVSSSGAAPLLRRSGAEEGGERACASRENLMMAHDGVGPSLAEATETALLRHSVLLVRHSIFGFVHPALPPPAILEWRLPSLPPARKQPLRWVDRPRSKGVWALCTRSPFAPACLPGRFPTSFHLLPHSPLRIFYPIVPDSFD